MPQRILALDINDSELKAAVLETTFRDYRVAGLYREAVEGDAPPEEQIRRFIAAHGNGVDTVLSALPGDKVTWRTFYLPFRDKKKLTQTIPFELENTVPFGLDDMVVDFQVLGRDRAGTTVLAALVPKRVLERHLEMLKEAGADPKVVGVGPLSTLNTLSLVADLPPTFAFLDCSSRAATVALYRERQLVGLRSLSWASAPPSDGTNGGGHGRTDEVSGWLAEVRWTLLALNGAPLDDDLPCYIAGDSDVVDAIQPRLEEVTGVRVRRLQGLKLSTVEPKANGLTPAFASSIGLALREVAPANALGINFRRGEFTFHRDQMEMSRALRSVGALLAVVVVLWVGHLYMQYWQLFDRVTGVDAEIQRVVNDALGTSGRKSNAVQQLQAEVDALRGRVELLEDVVPVSTSTGVDVLRAVSSAIPNRIRIDSEEYTMDPDAVRLRANTDTFESVDAIKQRLMESGFFDDVQVKDAKAAPNGTGVDFRLVLELNKSPVPRADQGAAPVEEAPARAPAAPRAKAPAGKAAGPAAAKPPVLGVNPPSAQTDPAAPQVNPAAPPADAGAPAAGLQGNRPVPQTNPAAPPAAPQANPPAAQPNAAGPQAGKSLLQHRPPGPSEVLPPASEHVLQMEKAREQGSPPGRESRRRQRGQGGRSRGGQQ